MVSALVGLKLKLLLAKVGSPRGAVAFAAAWFCSGVLACALVVLAIGVGATPNTPLALRAGITSAVWAAWIASPVLAPFVGFGGQSLETARMAVLPLRGRDLIKGLLVAGLIGPLPTLTAVGSVALTLGHARSLWGGVVAIMAAVLLVALCLSGQQMVAGALATRGSRRRGVVSVLSAVVVAGFVAVLWPVADGLDGLHAVITWNPAGQIGVALHDLQAGDVALALPHLVVPVVALALGLAWWARTIDRTLFAVVPDSGHPTGRSVVGPITRALPGGDHRFAAEVARQFVYLVRDPIRRLNWFTVCVIGTGALLYLSTGVIELPETAWVFLPVAVSLLAAGGVNANLWGLDGSAAWVEVVSSESLAADVRARATVAVVAGCPSVAIACLVIGRWSALPLALAALLSLTGASSYVGVRAPLRRPEHAFAASPDVGGRNIALTVVTQLAALAVLVPGFVLVLWGDSSGVWALATTGRVLVFAVGAGAWAVGTKLAARGATADPAGLMAAVSGWDAAAVPRPARELTGTLSRQTGGSAGDGR